MLARDIAELVFRKLIHLFAFAGMTDNSSNSVNLPEIFFMFLLQNYRYEKNYLNHSHSKRNLCSQIGVTGFALPALSKFFEIVFTRKVNRDAGIKNKELQIIEQLTKIIW